MKAADADILIVPGLNGSGADHWQTRWERKLSTARRVEQADWALPDREKWQANLITQAEQAERPVVLVAHSLGVITAVQTAERLSGIIAGAFLVAAPDMGASTLPPEGRALGPAPRDRLPFPAFLVASRTDPYCDFRAGEALARAWGALLIDAGAAGHLNPDSGHGPWPEGLLLFSRLLRNLRPRQLA